MTDKMTIKTYSRIAIAACIINWFIGFQTGKRNESTRSDTVVITVDKSGRATSIRNNTGLSLTNLQFKVLGMTK